MKNIFKSVLLIFFLTISCNEDDSIGNVLNNINYPYKQQVGYSASDILSNKKFTDIYIEVMYVDGFKPSAETLTNLKNFIGSRTYKSNIIIEERLINIALKSVYSMEDVRSIEDANRSIFSFENQLAISALFLNGKSSSDTDSTTILGTSYRNTSFVIFEETIKTTANNILGSSKITLESTVILHEFCHLLGLVNLGTNMVVNHEDTAHSAHCTVENCLMYYLIENGKNVPHWVKDTQIPQLDAYCINDLRANGGK
ncbi:MAG: membrane metalloprotease [Bacteroidetes bacterium HGW-Bacteroidetes-18]|nr:MAG: membrane metalloprotease [Bacteroidetes bacterium HGW-Bacteroidetes-18]